MRRAQLLSVALHAAAVLLLIYSPQYRTQVQESRPVIPLLTPFPKKNKLLAARDRDEGGGGGRKADRPVSKGRLPLELRPFVPPVIQAPEEPLLIQEAPILPADASLPSLDPRLVGSPFGEMQAYSPGRGTGTGLGDGSGPGIADGRGPGIGDGQGGYGAAAARRPPSLPVVLFKVEPEFTEEARKARLQGAVMLQIEVTAQGKVANVRVVRGIGFGLDERAVEAVLKWRFRPGMQDGKPVSAPATVEIYFYLL
jgi:protein TonB